MGAKVSGQWLGGTNRKHETSPATSNRESIEPKRPEMTIDDLRKQTGNQSVRQPRADVTQRNAQRARHTHPA